MAFPSVTYTFSNGTVASATEVNTNFTDIINGVSDGTKDWNGNAITAAGTATFNGTTNIGNSSGDDLNITSSLASSLAIKTNNTYNIGGAALGVASVYFSSSSSNTMRILFTSGISNLTWTMPGTAGTNGHALTSNGSGTFAFVPHQTGTNSVSAAYTILDTDGYHTILVTTGSSNRTIDLPTAADNAGRVIYMQKADNGTGQAILDGESAETIDDSTVKICAEQYDWVQVRCNGTSWNVIGMGNVTECRVKLENGNGYGSSSTRIRRFTNAIVNTGNSLTYADSATLGGTFTINRPGYYFINFSDTGNGTSAQMGISLNSNQLTTSIGSITTTHRLASSIFSSAGVDQAAVEVAIVVKLAAGDVIRAHGEAGGGDSTSVKCNFNIGLVRPT